MYFDIVLLSHGNKQKNSWKTLYVKDVTEELRRKIEFRGKKTSYPSRSRKTHYQVSFGQGWPRATFEYAIKSGEGENGTLWHVEYVDWERERERGVVSGTCSVFPDKTFTAPKVPVSGLFCPHHSFPAGWRNLLMRNAYTPVWFLLVCWCDEQFQEEGSGEDVKKSVYGLSSTVSLPLESVVRVSTDMFRACNEGWWYCTKFMKALVGCRTNVRWNGLL